MGRKPSDCSDKLWVRCKRGQKRAKEDKRGQRRIKKIKRAPVVVAPHRWGCSSRRPTSRSCWGEFHNQQFPSCRSHSWLQPLLWDNQPCPSPSSQQHTRGSLQQRGNETWVGSILGCPHSAKPPSSWWLSDLGVIGLTRIELHGIILNFKRG